MSTLHSEHTVDPPRAPLGPPRASSGLDLGQGVFWGGLGEVAGSRLRRLSVRSPFLELVTAATDPADATEVVASSAAQTPPSTRAGGQDDVS